MSSDDEVSIRTLIQKRDETGSVRHGAEWLQLWSDPHALKSDLEKQQLAQIENRRLRQQEALAANVRALSGLAALTVRIAPKNTAPPPLSLIEKTVTLPPIAGPTPAAEERGYADQLAFRLRYPRGVATFTSAKQNRIESQLWAARALCLGMADFAGTIQNILSFGRARLAQSGFSHSLLAADLPLDQALIWLCVHELRQDDRFLFEIGALEMWAGWLKRTLPGLFDEMTTTLSSAIAFTAAAEKAAARLLPHFPDITPNADPLQVNWLSDDCAADAPIDGSEENSTEDEEGDIATDTGLTPASATKSIPYRPFTSAHDDITPIDQLMDETALVAARDKLDRLGDEMTPALRRSAADLRRLLESRTISSWAFDQLEGLLDAGKLARIVSNPTQPLSFKAEKEAYELDCVVSLLVDNSGSMRGTALTQAAISADLIAGILNQCRIPFEVLGFTTKGFRGGQSYKDWIKAGKPSAPGRLCDLMHVIYKDADLAWRKSRVNLAGLLAPPMLADNIDGEAIQWAANRLLARAENRRILLVISDGAPAEKTTRTHNADHYLLMRHAKEAIHFCAHKNIEVKAIGIRHDVSHLYADALYLDDASDLTHSLLTQLKDLFS